MSRAKTHVKKGDVVEVITGAHKGSTGTVIQTLSKKNQVIIEGVRMIKIHQKRTQEQQEGGIIEREGPIHISNVKLIESAVKGDKKSKKGKQAA